MEVSLARKRSPRTLAGAVGGREQRTPDHSLPVVLPQPAVSRIVHAQARLDAIVAGRIELAGQFALWAAHEIKRQPLRGRVSHDDSNRQG